MTRFGKDYAVLYNSRRRVPFIPFALRNETGCRLQFATVRRTLTRFYCALLLCYLLLLYFVNIIFGVSE